ncbi:hypothetical protein BJ878DRAFT_477523 [Calycina marina]|uniref:Uncharacterized protein n=1 Tax=Calycina marina TaxID=1763456 RepID=A0A9P7Z8H6_9HELO|nr:hypothetical protein BJ878DRAFT_477523 [Calycina marina]
MDATSDDSFLTVRLRNALINEYTKSGSSLYSKAGCAFRSNARGHCVHALQAYFSPSCAFTSRAILHSRQTIISNEIRLLESLKVLACQPIPSDLMTKVHNEQNYNIYGRFNTNTLAAHATTAISATSNADPDKITEVLRNSLLAASEDCTIDGLGTAEDTVHSCWLCIRMTYPTAAWVVPRWHQDGHMFPAAVPSRKCLIPDTPSRFSDQGFESWFLAPLSRKRSTDEAGRVSANTACFGRNHAF